MEIGERKLIKISGSLRVYSRVINGVEYEFDVYSKDGKLYFIEAYDVHGENYLAHSFGSYPGGRK